METTLHAVCVRCGAAKTRHDHVCGGCGLRPEDEGLLVAWLLSEANLSPQQLHAVQQRIQGGESVRPGPEQLAKARRALGRDAASDPGLTVAERAALLLCTVFLTPLPAWVYGAWHLRERRRTALHALGLGALGSVLGFAVVWGRL